MIILKKYKINLTVVTSIIVSIILFLLFNREHFALDTYGFELDINNNISWYFSNGRIFMSLFLKICSLLNISFKNIKFISLILSLISLFISNIILFAMIIEGVLINPLSYKLLGLKYDNYKYYK